VDDVLQKWLYKGAPFVPKGRKLFLTHNMKEPYKILFTMIWILYGEEKNIHFKREWTPMSHYHYLIENGNIFNSDQLLFINIFETTRREPTLKNLCFFMSTYLIDVICATHHFIGMGWKWNPNLF
jgi:hypothetical protein